MKRITLGLFLLGVIMLVDAASGQSTDGRKGHASEVQLAGSDEKNDGLTQPWATLLAAFVASIVGSWAGATVALSRFKRERGFDKRIDWYARMATHLAKTKLEIEVARTIQEDSNEGGDSKADSWRQVQGNYLGLILLEAESKLYAPSEVVAAMRDVREQFDSLSEKTNGFDIAQLPNHIPEISQLTETIDVAMDRHVYAVRKDFGFSPLEKE